MPISFAVVTPPYRRIHALDEHRVRTPGSVIALRAERSQSATTEPFVDPARVVAIQRQYPFARLVAIVSPAWPSEAAFTAARVGFAAIVQADADLPRALRNALTQPVDLPRAIADWLTLHLPRTDARTIALVRRILSSARQFRTSRDLLQNLIEPERGTRERLRSARLPLTSDWLRLGRVLPVLLNAQRSPRKSLMTSGTESYSDQSVLSRQCVRLFGEPPISIRKTIGWHWWTAKYVERRGRGIRLF